MRNYSIFGGTGILLAAFFWENECYFKEMDSLPSLLVEPDLETAQGLPLTPWIEEEHTVK